MTNRVTTVYGRRHQTNELELRYKKKYVYGLNYPFLQSINNRPSGFFTKVTGSELRRDAAIQLLKTSPGERVMLPTFGAGLTKFLFEQMDEDTIEDIVEAITDSVETFLPEMEIISLQVGPKNAFLPDAEIEPFNVEYDENTARISLLLRNKDLQDVFVVYTSTGGDQQSISFQSEPVDEGTANAGLGGEGGGY